MSSLKKKNLRTKKFTTKLEPSLGEGAFLVAQTVKNLPATQETQVQTLHWEDPLEKGMATHSGILAWRILWTVRSWGCKEVHMAEQLTFALA